ncbi:hypothetical protein INH39_25520 [Massilia violaceinigra]|uniref:Uncharacterized protein n=1 Tax=Massilia violaceinigra TaxID=2045208 RepID=A0ABY4A219_9BURK|nr:hypothetical protein [Massilia violaceinigra]UOD28771.1 hypothetical protein INH39_25520 [Massilia violaceinigra]
MAAHKHAEIIKAWAEGAAIERYMGGGLWMKIGDTPRWDGSEYRIKPAAPEVEYPVTRMTVLELDCAWGDGRSSNGGGMKGVANAAIRHAIDSQQVVRMAEVQEIASQLGKDKRAARDMAVAEAVHRVHLSFSRALAHLDLDAVIAGVK